MNRILVVSALTETDMAQAIAWYSHIRPDLGLAFVFRVEQAFDRILDHPEAFPVILPGVRRTLIRRFPYGVFFRVRSHRIEVEALFQLRTDPTRLRERLGPTPDRAS